MFAFIIFSLLIVILWPLLSGGWRLWMQMRRMRSFMNDPFGAANRAGARRQQQQAPKKKKKIARDVGEYVAFTEVEASQTTTDPSGQSQTTDFVHEEQVTDVKWVDIE